MVSQSANAPVVYFNRYTHALETEAIYGEAFLRWAYGQPMGRLSVELAAKRAWFSHWYGWRMSRPASRSRIADFVRTFGLDPNEFVKSIDAFESFNDFFARKLQPESRTIASSPTVVTFPADGRHLGFPDLSQVDGVFVKNQRFALAELLGDPNLADRFERGTAVLSRLCPTDYHRFHFFGRRDSRIPSVGEWSSLFRKPARFEAATFVPLAKQTTNY